MPIQVTKAQQRITDLLKQKGVGVLATADITGEPHAATIYFSTDEDFNIYFVTKNETQKCKNLKSNARAALAVFEEKSQSTVQVTGVVVEVEDATLANKIFAEILKITATHSETVVPPISKLQAGQYVVFKMTPGSMRMASFVQSDPGNYEQIFEFA